MDTKKFTAEVKAVAVEGDKPGTFEAVVAVFDNVDRVGDRIKSSAFDGTLKAWQESGDPIPVIFSHKHDDPMAHIGYANPEDVKAVPGRGLVVKGQLDVDTNPLAAQVYTLMQRRSLKEFSFGYTVPAGGMTKARDGAFDLNKIDLFEFGPTLKGVNDETELLAVKSLLEKSDDDQPSAAKLIAELQAKSELLEQQVAVLANAAGIEFKYEVTIETKTEDEVDEKAHVELDGTAEAAHEAVEDAVRAKYATDPATWARIEGTYPDRVVFCLTSGDSEGKTFEAPYSTNDAGEIEIGDAVEVEIQATVVPKADEVEEKTANPELEVFELQLSLHDSKATAEEREIAEFQRALDGKASLAADRNAVAEEKAKRSAEASAARRIQEALDSAARAEEQ